MKIYKLLNKIGYLIVVIIFLTTLFPEFFFEKKISYKSYTIYTNYKIPEGYKQVIDKSESLIKKSEIYQPKHKQKIFICNNDFLFTLFAKFSRKAFAINNPMTNDIFIADADFSKNKSRSKSKNFNIRTLSGVIAHETCHSLLRNKLKLGLIKYRFSSIWKIEGYCDFIAKETSHNFQKGINLLCEQKKNKESKSFEYFKYKLYIDYLIKDKKIKINEILKQDYNIDTLDRKISDKFCSNLE